MGRGKKDQKSLRVDDDAEDDNCSSCSTSASSDLAVNPRMYEEIDREALLEGFVEALYEKRASTREAGLKGLVTAFTENILVDFVEREWERLSDFCIGCIKRGSSSEAAMAARVIGLMILTVGAGNSANVLFVQAWPHLAKVAKLGSSSSTRISALQSLAVVCFIGGVSENYSTAVMGILWQIATHEGNEHADQTFGITTPSSEVRAAAISSWAVILSTLSVTSIINNLDLSSLSAFLDTGSLVIQRAAGEAIALISEAKTREDSNFIQEKEDPLLEQMRALSIQAGGKGHSRKGLSSQRNEFRGLVRSIEDGVCPETHVRLRHGDVLKVDSWTRTLQLNALRNFLAEGFQIHIQENPVIHSGLGFTPRQEKEKALSSKEKRLFHSPNSVTSKKRTQTRNLHRSIAEAGNVGHYNLNDSNLDSY